MIKLPKTVTILSHEYQIVRVPQEEIDDNYGIVKFEEQTIYLADHLNGDFLRETLLHEVLHIIDYYTAGANNQVKERDIHRLSHVLFDTLRKNPALIKRVFRIH